MRTLDLAVFHEYSWLERSLKKESAVRSPWCTQPNASSTV